MIPSEELIHMAREAGFQIRGDIIRTMHSSGACVGVNEELERFATLVEARAAASEREACLEVANLCADADMHASMAANAIRARGTP